MNGFVGGGTGAPERVTVVGAHRGPGTATRLALPTEPAALFGADGRRL